jgi:hypothetical protein
MNRALLFFCFFTMHFVVQFLVWAKVDSIHGARPAIQVLWMVLAAPLVTAAGSLTEHFWAIAFLNSAAWAAALTYLGTRLILRKKALAA